MLFKIRNKENVQLLLTKFIFVLQIQIQTSNKHIEWKNTSIINNENFYHLINRTLAFKILAVNATLKKVTKRG